MEELLRKKIAKIEALDQNAMDQAAAYQAQLAKPPGSLGKLETMAVQLAGITGRVQNRMERRRILVLCADNGVLSEGVSVTPRTVTASQAVNMTLHKTGMSSMAYFFGDEVTVVDVGIADPYHCPKILNRSIAKGTKNLVKEPAMTRLETVQAMLVGMDLAKQAAQDGVDAVGVGEMGIGNTTTSAAVLAALTGLPVEAVTGRGGGLTDEAFLRKKQVIESALVLHQPDSGDPIAVMSAVGGLDLAAMCGVYLGCALERIPVVMDGFISIVAALCASRLCGRVRGYLIPSHASFEKGYEAAADELGVAPYLLLGMRLGEGSGCPLAFQVLRAACAVMGGMATFADAAINDSYLDEIREKDCFTT